LTLYIASEYECETRFNHYFFKCQWAQGTGFQFHESNEPKTPQRYTTRPTLETWEEFVARCDGETNQQPQQRVATDEELNEILYGDSNFNEETGA